MAIRLAITDDHHLVREGLVQYLSMSPDIQIVAEAASGEEILKKLRVITPDLLLLDMAMPGKSGVDLIRHIKSLYPDMLILVFSIHNEVGMVLGAMKAGASGYACKDCSPQSLVDIIRKIAATGKYLNPQMEEQLAYAASLPESENIVHVLSEREP